MQSSIYLKASFYLFFIGNGVPSRKITSYFSTKTYVVRTQKNPLNETDLLSSHSIRLSTKTCLN